MYYRLLYLDKNSLLAYFLPSLVCISSFNDIYFQRSEVLFGEISSSLYFKDFICIFMCCRPKHKTSKTVKFIKENEKNLVDLKGGQNCLEHIHT